MAQSPQQQGGVFMQQPSAPGGPPQAGEMLQMVSAKVQELDKWAGEMNMLLQQIAPPLRAFLGPIADAGLQLQQAVKQMAERSGMLRGSPAVPATPPPNPAAGPANPNVL